MRKIYQYRVVIGCGVYGEPCNLKKARVLVNLVRTVGWYGFPPSPAEIERILHLDSGGERYWRWRNGKWNLKFWTEPTPADLDHWNP